MQGIVYKIHSDFYYVKNLQHVEFVCKLRELLKKRKTDIVTGDRVEFEDGIILERLERTNFLPRPKCANIDCTVIVTPLKEPELDLIQLNRYLAFFKYYGIESVICFNKEDLIKKADVTDFEDEIKKIYKNLGCKMFFISAKTKTGVEPLIKFIKNKTITLCGQSGAGKTTLLNLFNPEISSKTNEVSLKTQRGQHTTRHCEIFECEGFKVIDTPGFSRLKFDFLLPEELINLFDDIKKYKDGCKYANCLHNVKEKGICSIFDNRDKIPQSRYQSYLCFLEEASEYKKEISKKSIKNETFQKSTGNKTVAKISKRKRNVSRSTERQNVKKEHHVD